MALVKMPNGSLIAQTMEDTDVVPAGYVRSHTDPRRFLPKGGKGRAGCATCKAKARARR